ncbi:MAG TPA: PLP-dependent aminotransferase family protein [Bryobacteraceae bacterium]|nr:PLP-dependent aminotransferase family protein [Bryobacteraceae bacterium]
MQVVEMYHYGVGKTATSVDLALHPPPDGAVLFRWLYHEIRSAILEGRLRRGARLPATRELAKRYRISRGTVISTFDQLQAEGYLEARVGAGTRVNTHLPEDLLPAKSGVSAAGARKSPRPKLSKYGLRLTPAPDVRVPPPRPFRLLTPAFDAFPLSLWSQIASRRLRGVTRQLLADENPRGYRPLREAVSAYLGSARGVRCTWDQVIILAGIQQALDLTARIVLDPGDEVWLEDPCAFLVADMFRAMGARVVPVPVDDQGLNVAEGRRRSRRAKLAYVTPAHQFPLGVSMSASRRLALLDWARQSGALIFEDDYDSEYRYAGRPLPSLQGIDTTGSVILAGSFSKVLFPSLRLGYLVASGELVEKFAAGRMLMDRHSSLIDQAILCDFITAGHFGSHIRRMRELYAGRLAVLCDAVRRKLRGALEIGETQAGMHTVGWLAVGLDAGAVAKAAMERNVEAIPLRRFCLKARHPEGLLLGFASVDDNELRRGVDRLAAALEDCSRRSSNEPGASLRGSRSG